MQDVRKAVVAALPACETMVAEIVLRTRDVNEEVSSQTCAALEALHTGACRH